MKPFDPWKLVPFWREFLLFGLAAGTGIWTWIRTRQAQSWFSAQGTIISTTVRSAGDRQFKPWIAELTYTYVVNGEYYSGFHNLRARSERRAEELIFGWKGRMVVVRYSPKDHETSVLLKNDQPGNQLGNA